MLNALRLKKLPAKLIALIFGVFISNFSVAQTTLWTDDANNLDAWANSGTANWQAIDPPGGNYPTDDHNGGGNCFFTAGTSGYTNNKTYQLESPVIDLSAYKNGTLTFWMYMNTEDGFDGGFLELYDGGSWQKVPSDELTLAYDGTLGSTTDYGEEDGWVNDYTSWTKVEVDISAYHNANFQIRFNFGSDNLNKEEGWGIDDLSLAAEPINTAIVWQDNADAKGNWSYSGGGPWMNVDPATPTDDHTGGGKCFYTGGNGNYTDGTVEHILTSPSINLSSYQNLELSFWMYLDTEDGTENYDGGFIEVYDGSSWVKVTDDRKQPQYDGALWENNVYPGENAWITDRIQWTRVQVDVSDYANAAFQVRFKFGSDPATNADGWAIDDLKITTKCQLFTETFENYSTGDLATTDDGSARWLMNETTPSVNDWAIGNGAGAINDTRGLNISDGDEASYDNTDDAQVTAYYSQKIDARNYTNIQLSMHWKADGSTGNDYGKIVYSTNGVNWYETDRTFSGEGASLQEMLFDISELEQKQFYLGFRWYNDGDGAGTNPAFTIDDIKLYGQPGLNYNFSVSQTEYQEISGTIVGMDGNDGSNINLPAGFNFNYVDTSYASLRISQNGWAHLYNISPDYSATGATNDLASLTANRILAPLWDDLSTDDQSAITYKTEGASPNRVFAVEWKNMIWDDARVNFQLRLYETTNVIEFVYGRVDNPAVADGASIGINGACHTAYISVTPGATHTISEKLPNNGITSNNNMTEGLIYTFSPYAMQAYNTWQAANILIGQTDWSNNDDAIADETEGQKIAPGASSSAVSSRNMLAVGSQTHNRVMLWNEVPSSNGAPADVVLGQTNFSNSAQATTQSGFNQPEDVVFSPDGEKLLVADGNNNRVLIWNSIPTTNGTSADVVIGQDDFVSGKPNQDLATCYDFTQNHPTGITFSSDGRLIITDKDNHRVLIYNKIPTTNEKGADVIIGQTDAISNTPGTSKSEFDTPWDAAVAPDGRLLVSDDGNNRILVFDSIPTSNGAEASVVIGQETFTASALGNAADEFDRPNVSVSPEGKLACGDFGNNRVLLFNRIPTENGVAADQVLGQDDFDEGYEFSDGTQTTTSPSERNMYTPYSVNFDLNGRLLVNGRNMNRVMLFGDAPTASADLEITFTVQDEATNCIGTPVTYTLTIANNGPDMATNVVVKTALPAQFTLTETSASAGRYNGKNGYWNIPAISSGNSQKLTFTGKADNNGGTEDITAYASIKSSLQKDPDFSNNAASVEITVEGNNVPDIGTTNLQDQNIARNASANLAFMVTDNENDPISMSKASGNTTLAPESGIGYTTAHPDYTVTISPATDEYGYSDISVIATDDQGCKNTHTFELSVGNVWEGDDNTQNRAWNVSENWSGSVPNSTKEAIIPTSPLGGSGNYPVISSDVVVQDILVEPGASLTLNGGYKLDLYGDFRLQSNEGATAAFVDLNTQAQLDAGKGLNKAGSNQQLIAERYLEGGKWHYVAAPTTQASTSLFTNAYGGNYFNPNFFYYDESNQSSSWRDGWTQAYQDEETPGALSPAEGYGVIYERHTSPIIPISGGDFNSGNISYEVTYTTNPNVSADKQGWNLIGNPYASGLNADEFLDENNVTNGEIDGTLYFWDESGFDDFANGSDLYAYYNGAGYLGNGSGSVKPDKFISSGQAFFVHASGANGNVLFKNSMREVKNSHFYKNRQSKVQRITLSLMGNNYYNEQMLAFTEKASAGFDTRFDAYKLGSKDKFSFYSWLNGNRMAIQAFKPVSPDSGILIQIGVHVSKAGSYSFNRLAIEGLPENISVSLIDSVRDTRINLRKQRSYKVKLDTGGHSKRFWVQVGDNISTVNGKNTAESNVQLYAHRRNLVVEQDRPLKGRLEIWDLTGRRLKTFNVPASTQARFRTNLSTGIYLLRFVTPEKSHAQKVILH